jgi:Flp pilus assembly protein TadG
MHRFLRRRCPARSETGAALIEFTLVLPLLVLLLFAMLEFGKAFNYWIDETHLANEGARWAVVDKNPGAGSGTSLQEYIKEQATTSELRNGGTPSVSSPAQVCITFPAGTSNAGDPVHVEVTATYNWLSVLGLDVTSTDLVGRSTMRLETEPSNYTAGCA